MSLLAVNENWAVYSKDVTAEKIDPFKTLEHLLEIKTYSQLIDFLVNYTCNDNFLFECFAAKLCDVKQQSWFPKVQQNMPVVKGDCMNTLDNYPNIEYLDKLYLSDNFNKKVYWLSIYEMLSLRDFILQILTLAGIALGSQTYPDIFITLDGSRDFESNLIGEIYDAMPTNINNVGINITNSGFGPNNIMSDGIFDDFEDVVNYKTNLLKSLSNKYANTFEKYKYESGDVILSVQEYPDDASNNTSGTMFGIWFSNDITKEQAIRFLSGKIIELIINNRANNLFLKSDFNNPYSFNKDSCIEYIFSPKEGFVSYSSNDLSWWAYALVDKALQLIIDNKVSICPICNRPFLIKSNQGRKIKSVCSDSCKTKASKQRREVSFRNAAAGIPIEKTISILGKEYETSIRRWYSEVSTLTP